MSNQVIAGLQKQVKFLQKQNAELQGALCEKESSKKPITKKIVTDNISLLSINEKLNKFLNEEKKKPIINTFHFGKTDLTFNFKFVKYLVQNKDIDAIIDYYRIHFVKMDVKQGVAMWFPSFNKVLLIPDECFKRTYCPKDFRVIIIEGGKVIRDWKIVDWFYSCDNEPFKQTQKVGGDRLYIDKHGTQFLNLFPELLHAKKERKPLTSYSKQTQEGVNKIWDHLSVAWASNKKDQYTYIRKWFAHFVSGRKMTSALYLRAVEGIGKSIVIDFLKDYVLGPSVVYQTSDSEILSSQFNAPLLGIMLFVLEEAPCSTLGEWKKLDSKLKNYITEKTISIRLMRENAFDTNNTVSFIINTNSYAIAMNHGTRRYFSSDCSSVYKGNRNYFIELAKIMRNEEVGEAFYFNCLDIAEEFPDFHEQFECPVTDEFIKNINDNISSVYNFIKLKYVLKKKGINSKYDDFYKEYVRFCTRSPSDQKTKNFLKKGQFGDKLKDIGINLMISSTRHHNKSWIENTSNELYDLFKKSNLIAETDDFVEIDSDADEKQQEQQYNDMMFSRNEQLNANLEATKQFTTSLHSMVNGILSNKPNEEFLIDPVELPKVIDNSNDEEPFDLCKELQKSIDDLTINIEYSTEMLPFIMEPYPLHSKKNNEESPDSSDEESIDSSDISKTVDIGKDVDNMKSLLKEFKKKGKD
jgi:hypothetical protein